MLHFVFNVGFSLQNINEGVIYECQNGNKLMVLICEVKLL